MLGIQRLLIFLLILVCLVRTNEIIGRTVCLADLLEFYHKTRASCSFTRGWFTRNVKDSQRTCLVKCTLKKLTPELRSPTWYKLENLQINLFNTFTFKTMKLCTRYRNTNVEIAVECDKREFYGFQTNSVPNPTNPLSVDIPETTLRYMYSSRESLQTSSLPNLTKTLSAEVPATTSKYSSKEMAKNRDPPVGIIVGAAATGFVSGIIVCGIVCFMLSRCKESTSTKRSVESAATVDNYEFEVAAISAGKSEQRTVQVSQNDVNRKGGTVPLEGIYNHLHETSGMSGIEPEYDHVPCNGTDDETYHHLNLGNTKNVNTVTRADLENHYN